MLESLLITIVIAIIIWVAADNFSPHPALTIIVKCVVFVYVILKLLPLMGVHAF